MNMEYLSGVKKEKLANTIVFFAEKLHNISKTKLLKLIYLVEEYYIKKYRIPFLDIDFEIWQAGPVNKEVFSELSDSPVILKDYIENIQEGKSTIIKPLRAFCDDEFSDNELEMLQYIVDNFGGYTANQLVEITHRTISPWYIIAQEKGLLESFKKGMRNTSEEKIDFERFFCDSEENSKKFKEQKMFNSFVQHFSE
jgi:uncharacterized phage-associated protein